MNKVLENALKRAGQWPESAQQELAEIAVQIDRELAAGPYQPTTEELAGIEVIRRVGVVLVPEHLTSRLAAVPMEEVGVTVPVPTGENVRMVTGQMKTTGEALAHPGTEEDVLVVAGFR